MGEAFVDIARLFASSSFLYVYSGLLILLTAVAIVRNHISITAEAQVAGGISALCFVIWAVTGGGYFWPAWVWLSLALILALVVAWR